MKYKGSCHCGAIQFQFEGPEITEGVRCNCSICRRKGATMTTYTVESGNISIEASEKILSKYEFGSCVAQHYFCSGCGIYPFHQSMLKPGQYRLNTGCIDGIDSSNLPFTVFDGVSL